MATIPGSVRVAGFIAPSDTTDTYPTHDALYGKGGHREVVSLVARDAIPSARLRVGMLCYVAEDGVTYQLTAMGWAPFSGAASGTATGIAVTAAIDLGGHRVVTVDGYYADALDITTMYRVAGITIQAVSAAESVTAYNSGVLVEASWNWTVGQPVYLGTNGLMTQEAPTTGYLLVIGQPKNSTSLIVGIQQPILLA